MRGPILKSYRSKSNPFGPQHEVRLGKDGVVYCTCKGWRYHRHCWHLDEVKAILARAISKAA